MDNDSGDRSVPVQDNENNDSREQSPTPISQTRHRNEGKGSLPNRKQESQSRVIKRKKRSRKQKVSTSGEGSGSSSTDSSSLAKKKKKAKLQQHHQPTPSSSLTASNSSTDEESHNDRFKIITENEKFKWKLPKSMANYTNKYFEDYVPENSLKEDILCQNPVLGKIDNIKKLDDFLRDVLKEKRKTNEQNTVQEDTVQISISDLLHYVEETVLLLGQSSNAITYD